MSTNSSTEVRFPERRLPEAMPPLGTPSAPAGGQASNAFPALLHPRLVPGELVRAADTAAVLAALLAVFFVTNLEQISLAPDHFLGTRISIRNALLVGSLLIIWQIVFSLLGLYDRRRFATPADELRAVAAASAVGGAAAFVLPLLTRSDAFQLHDAFAFWLAAGVATAAVRFGLQGAEKLGAPRTGPRRVLIVGSGPRSENLARLLSTPDGQREVVGFVDTNDRIPSPAVRHRLLGDLDQLEEILMRTAIDEVAIGLPIRSHYAQIEEAIEVCERVGVESKYPADLFEPALARPILEPSTSLPLVALKVVPDDFRLTVKRVVDVVGAAVGLVLLAPVLLAIAAAIKLSSPGPVIFAQDRYGYNRRLFRMYKFRSMVPDAERLQSSLEHRNEAEGPAFKIHDDPRVTRIGRLLRRTSMDELPQLFNVLRGDMSLVGPRPLPTRDVHHFSDAWLMRRFSMPPGLTCLWQISGRSNLDFDDWIALDLRYIDGWSLGLDLRILAMTIPAVIRGNGAT